MFFTACNCSSVAARLDVPKPATSKVVFCKPVIYPVDPSMVTGLPLLPIMTLPSLPSIVTVLSVPSVPLLPLLKVVTPSAPKATLPVPAVFVIDVISSNAPLTLTAYVLAVPSVPSVTVVFLPSTTFTDAFAIPSTAFLDTPTP